MKGIVSFMTLVLTFSIVSIAFAGTNYNCQLPVSIKIDGDLSDWKGVEFILVPHDKGTGPAPTDSDASLKFATVADANWLYVAIDIKDDVIKFGETNDWQDDSVPADNDKDASVKFATAADEKYIYVAAEITDEKIRKGENTKCDVWNDDSIEVYIDGGNDKAGSYDANDAQITVGADVIGAKPDAGVTAALLGGCVGITQGPTTETIATGEATASGWNVEIAIPLKNKGWDIKPKDGLKIGFNVQYNDDDDGAGRDHKLIWCVKEVKQGEGSWNNPSLFAELQFVQAVLAVNPDCKMTITWAFIKSYF